MRRAAFLGMTLALSASARLEAAPATDTVDRNVIYGMYSGLALLMDVYKPARPNGAGVIAIQGSGWYQPMRYDASLLSSRTGVIAYARDLSQAGYTVFV